ncbi:MAG TPA: DUF362 domain-containing protein [Clostridia bacterium]|nr:DUF362 domain-containing protein [Clostridia bacterium]
MLKLKSIIIYGIILILCVAAVAGYFMTRSGESGDIAAQATGIAGTDAAAAGGTPADSQNAGDSTATATDGAGAAASTGVAADDINGSGSNTPDAHVMEVMQKSVAEPDPNPVVGIGRGTDHAKVTEEAVKNAGGIDGIIKKGDTVVIKPNLCTLAEATDGRITDYRVVQKVVDMVKALGASRVIIAEGTIAGDAFSSTYLKRNKFDVINGAELVNLNALNEEDCYELMPEKSMTGKGIFIPKIYMDADVVIGVAKLKTHFQPDAVVSLSLKNSYGVPPGNIYGLGSKNGLHALGLKESIVDINKIRKPDFFIIDGIVGGEGYGPLRNTPVDSQIVFAGRDPVALDTAAATFMGFTVDEIPHLKLASDEKLGISDLGSIKIVGADLEKIKMKFERAF